MLRVRPWTRAVSVVGGEVSVIATHRYEMELPRGARIILVEAVPSPESAQGDTFSLTVYDELNEALFAEPGEPTPDPKYVQHWISQDQLRDLVNLAQAALRVHDELKGRLR